MEKKKCLAMVFEASELYKKNLLGKSLLIIGQNSTDSQYSYFEAGFETRHFMHLTGLAGVPPIDSKRFFDKCVSRRLGIEDFTMVSETDLKLSVIKEMMSLPYIAKMTGKMGSSGNYLRTDTLAGGVHACMGFVEETGTPYLVPNTLLKGDIRNLLKDAPKQIVAIYIKPFEDTSYTTLASVAKKFRHKELKWPEQIERLIQK